MNDYRNYYNAINNYNSMKNVYENSQNNGTEINPYIGFLRGNLFDDLYVPYMNYKPIEINPISEKEYDMLMIQTYSFAAHELDLYLDVNPNDGNIINLRDKYIKHYKEAKTNYENKYGPIDLSSKLLSNNPWMWDSKIWPWEGDK